MTTLERIRKVIVELPGVEESEVTENANIYHTLCAGDLLDWYEIIVGCELEFEIGEISDDEVNEHTTVKQLVDFIDQKVAA